MALSAPLSLVRRFYSTTLDKMVKAKKYVMIRHFKGEPKLADIKIVEEELPALKDGEYLCKAEYLSVDPYMRPYMLRFPAPCDMIGSQVARIIESKNEKFPVNRLVVGQFGWRDYTVVKPKPNLSFDYQTYLVPELPSKLPSSLALGTLGMPGNTAYFGFLEICQPKPGETVVVTGAAGAVGSHVGQIAKIKGCKVIGFAGSDVKCKWLKELGFDHAINYKTANCFQALKEAAPNGVDCYFDNVGGELSSTIINQMNKYGRVSICGSISVYNEDLTNLPKATIIQPRLVFNEIKMEGFIVHRWHDRWEEGIKQNLKWIQEGKVKYEETITEGFDNMFEAFVGMLRGDNTGKAIVKY